MSPNERLREARRKAGYKTPTEAARALKSKGINQHTLISHENGNRPISRKAAALYGKVFNVDPGWLLFGPLGQERSERLRRAFERVAAAPPALQERILIFAEDELDEFERQKSNRETAA